MGDSGEDFREAMRAKTDDELYLILSVHSQDYTLQSLTVVREELSQRQKMEPTSRREKMLNRLFAVAGSTLEATEEANGGSGQNHTSDAKEPASGWGWSDIKSDWAAGYGCWGWLVLLCFVGYAGYGGYEWLDSIGWVSHREETVISARSDWLVGESKECTSYPRKKKWDTIQDKEVGYAMPWIKCDDGADHHMKVIFYGRRVQPEYQTIGWRCKREQTWFGSDNSFTCNQTGGDR